MYCISIFTDLGSSGFPCHCIRRTWKRSSGTIIHNRLHVFRKLCSFRWCHQLFVAFRHIFLHRCACIICNLVHQIRLHQLSTICDRRNDHRHMVRTDLCLSLTNCSHHRICISCICFQAETAFIIFHITRKLAVKQHLFGSLSPFCLIQLQPDIWKRRIAGICNRIRQILFPMSSAVITVDRCPILWEFSVTFKRIIVIIWILPHKSKCCHQLECRPWCILSKCSPVKKRTVFLIVQCIPVFRNIIRIKRRLRYHCQDLPCTWLHHDNCTFVISQCIICCILQVRIQGCDHRISRILLVFKFIRQLFQEKGIWSQKIEILWGFQSGFSFCGISDNMCKHFSFRIFPCFRSIVICHSLCKHFSIFICNTATQHTVRKKILTDIVRAVDNLFTFYHIKINQISHQYQKQCYKNISNSRQFFIGHLLLFFLTGSASFCLCFFRTPLSVF